MQYVNFVFGDEDESVMHTAPVAADDAGYLKRISAVLRPLSEEDYMKGPAVIMHTAAKYSYVLNDLDVRDFDRTMPDVPQIIYVAAGAEQAHLLANALRDRGMEALVTNDRLQAGLGVLPFGWSTAPWIVVPERDAEEARRIVLELVGETPAVPRPFQFRMRTVLYAVTACSVYLAVDRITGWKLSGFIPLFLGSFEFLLLLVVIVMVIRRKRIERVNNAADS